LRREAQAELDSWSATQEVADGDHLDQSSLSMLARIGLEHWAGPLACLGTTLGDLKQLRPPGDLIALGITDPAELRKLQSELDRLRTHG